MIKAKANDGALVVELLTRSFKDNQSVNYIIRQDDQREKRIRALMAYSFKVCMMFGEVWLSADRKACALVLFPDQKKTTLEAIWLDIKLILSAISLGGISKALKREAQIKKKQPKIPMYYLWFIGVNQLNQHKGIGSKLLQEIIKVADQKKLPIFLETSTLTNLPWYERFGFKIYDQLQLSYTLYFLERESNNI